MGRISFVLVFFINARCKFCEIANHLWYHVKLNINLGKLIFTLFLSEDYCPVPYICESSVLNYDSFTKDYYANVISFLPDMFVFLV